MTKIPEYEKAASLQELLNKPEQNHVALTAALFFLSCLVLPFSNHERVAAIFLLGAAAFYYLLNRSIRSLLYYIIPALLLYGLSAFIPGVGTPMLLPCAFAAMILGGSCGAFLLIHFHRPRHWYLLLLPAAAYLAAGLISGSYTRSLLTLLPAAVAIVSAFCVLKCVARTDATVLVATAVGVLLAVSGVITLAVYGMLNGNPLTMLADQFRANTVLLFDDLRALYAEAGMAFPLSDVSISNLAATFVNILPALFLCACCITAFLVWRLLINLLISYRSLHRIPTRLLAFSMSRTSAVLFLLALLISFFANSSSVTVVGVICQNIYLVLVPGLSMIGFASLFSRGPSASCLSRVIAFGLILLLLYNPLAALTMTAAFGAINILAARFLPSPGDPNDKQ